MASRHPPGKLPQAVLTRLLDRHVAGGGGELALGPAVGEDAAALRLPCGGEDGDLLVVASDPVTFATDAIGHYVVHINANDLAATGARPRWFLVTLLLPPGTDTGTVDGIFAGIAAACEDLGVTWCGGHTEVTAGLPRPLAAGTMLGLAPASRLLRTAAARPGDLVWCTKTVPLEASALLAREWPGWAAGCVGEEAASRVAGYLFEPGISVVPEALAAATAGATCLHDPTEGGLATGLAEIATASATGLRIEHDALPLDPGGRALCEAAGIDPLGALASGSLLVVAPPERGPAVETAVADVGVPCVRIGEVVEARRGVRMRRDGRWRDLPRFQVDEIARLFTRGGPEGTG